MARFLVLLIALTALGQPEGTQQIGKGKADKLRSLSNDYGGVIELTLESFRYFVIEQPRPYNFVILFTTSSTKYKCASCEEVQEIFGQIGYSYKKEGSEYPSVSSNGEKSRAVFFGILEYGPPTQAIYQKLNLVSVPNILITQPKSIIDDGSKYITKEDDLWKFTMSNDIHTQKVLDFVNKRLKKNVEIKIPPLENFLSLLYSLIVLGVIGVTGYQLRSLILIPYLWFIVSIFIYTVCIAGVVYDIIHNVPWIGSNGDGKPEFIHGGQRSQYGFEGFLMSFIICLGGLSLVGFNLISKLKSPWTMRVAGFLCLAVFFYCATRILNVYRIKANWYNPGMDPPSHYVRGPLIRDQGNSF
jgi:oligosaccharyltransferase complex subunit gamma